MLPWYVTISQVNATCVLLLFFSNIFFPLLHHTFHHYPYYMLFPPIFSFFICFSPFVRLVSVFHVPVTCYTHLNKVKFTVCRKLYSCFSFCICNKKYSGRYDFVLSILRRQFLLHLWLALSSVILQNYKRSNWFYILYWPSLALYISPNMQCVRWTKNWNCLKNIFWATLKKPF